MKKMEKVLVNIYVWASSDPPQLTDEAHIVGHPITIIIFFILFFRLSFHFSKTSSDFDYDKLLLL